MSSQASIDFSLSKPCEPREIILELIKSGWDINFDSEVTFLPPSDIESYDWQSEKVIKFNLDHFLNDHKFSSRIGIVMVFGGRFGGEFLIFKEWISLSLSINRVCIFEKVPDFSLYISKLTCIVNKFCPSEIKCEYLV